MALRIVPSSMRTLISTLLTTALLAPSAAEAKTHEGVQMDDEIVVEGKKLVLNGMTMKEATFLKVNVFVVGLYLERKLQDPVEIIRCRQTQRLLLQFKRTIDDGVLPKRWMEALTERAEEDAAFDLPKLKARIAELGKYIPDVKDGDRLRFTFVPGKGVEVWHNDRVRGTVKGADFCALVFDGFFGPESDKSVRKGLLGR